MKALEKGYLKKVKFARQGAFYPSSVNNAETQADAAIGTELAGHGDQFAGNIFGLDDFFRPQGVADGFKEYDAEWVFRGHRRYPVLSESDDFVKSHEFPSLSTGKGSGRGKLF
jgi:hypothetical protein